MSSDAVGGIFSGLIDFGEGLFGTSQAQSGSGTRDATARDSGTSFSRRKVKVNRAAIDKTIADILSGNEGLASILQDEQGAGIFNSTVAQDAIGELIAKVAGEVGKLTTEEEQIQEFDQKKKLSETTTSRQDQETGGLLDTIFGGIF